MGAARSGVLVESTPGLELKRELKSGAAANKELAKDLASLAVAGGTLIIGVVDESQRDPDDPEPALHPVPLEGLGERVEQVALTRCGPPLTVTSSPITAGDHPSLGYLVVHVPPSAVAPHMVDGRYWGRGELTKRSLSDAEVVALHEQRRRFNMDAAEELKGYTFRDPFIEADEPGSSAHLFIVAVPRPGQEGMLRRALGGSEGWQPHLFELLHERRSEDPPWGLWSPDFDSASSWSTRSDGWAATSFDLRPGRTLREGAKEQDVIEVEWSEDGVVRVFCGRASDTHPRDPEANFVIDDLVAGLTFRAVRLAGDVSGKGGYHGSWALGVGISNLRSSVSTRLANAFNGSGNPYTSDEYRGLTRATALEMASQPGAVVERLVGRLFRALGSYTDSRLDIFFDRASSPG